MHLALDIAEKLIEEDYDKSKSRHCILSECIKVPQELQKDENFFLRANVLMKRCKIALTMIDNEHLQEAPFPKKMADAGKVSKPLPSCMCRPEAHMRRSVFARATDSLQRNPQP